MTYIEFKQGEKYAQTGADTSPMHETFQDCGYMLESTDIVIDIDNFPKETINAMIETFGIKTQIVWTKRGCHLYFEKPKGMKVKKDSLNALGVEFEYKDSKNTPNGITIKQNGELRKIDNPSVREPLPDFLQPMNKVESLLGLGDGDKTNSRLYSHKFKIMKLPNWKQVMKFINEHIIAYPFEDKEFQTIIRDEQLRTKDGNISEYDVAMTLNNELKLTKVEKQYYIYDGVRYHQDEDEIVEIVADRLRGQTIRYQDEVIKQMKRYPKKIDERDGGFDIKFKNGILRDGIFYDVQSDEFTPYYIDINYNPDAEPVEIIDYFFDNLSKGRDGLEPEPEYKQFLFEVVAHCLITDINFKKKRPFQRVFFFAGEGGNGKGAYFKLIKTMLGKGNYKTNKLEKFGDERYVYGMRGKLANLGDDIEDVAIKPNVMSNLKSMSAYEEVELRQLFGMPINTEITATQMFTTNHILKSFEKGNAWERRVVWCPMYATPEREFDDFYKELLDEKALEYFLKLVIDALNRLKENGNFTTSKRVQEFTDEYHKDNDPCTEYVGLFDVDYFIGKTCADVFTEYETWCNNSGVKASQRQLGLTLKKVHGLKSKTVKKHGRTYQLEE